MLLDPVNKTSTPLARFLDIKTPKTHFPFCGGALAPPFEKFCKNSQYDPRIILEIYCQKIS